MSGSRTKNSFRNIFVNIGCQIVQLLVSFVSRTMFIKILGADYLGINGLFTNILSILSLANLGFGTAIVYNLYKYLAEDNKKMIAANINFYGRIYKIIACVIFVIGIALIPFLQYIVKLDNNIPHLKLYYVLFLLNSVMSYLFVYKSNIFNADQKNYITKINHTIFLILMNIIQIFVLYYTHKYFFYLCVQVIITLISNIVIYLYAEKEYPYLKNSREMLSKEEKNKIIDNVKSLFFYKIGGVIMNNTTNILISVIVNTTTVGFYSNYTLLSGLLITFSELIFGGINASIGNYANTNSKENNCRLFYMLNFGNFWVYGFSCIVLFCLMDDFIYLWIGKEYVLGPVTSLIICMIVFVPNMLTAVTSFRTVTGMFRETKYVFLITSILNLIFAAIFGKMWGLNGVLLGAIVSRLLTNVWYEPYILLKKKFSSSIRHFVFKMIKYYFITFALIFVIYVIKKQFFTLSWFTFISELVISVICINIIFYILFHTTQEFQDLKEKIIVLYKK